MSLRMWRKNGPMISVEGRRGHFDIAYGNESAAQKLDIFLPEKKEKKYPVIISIHGGGYVACDKRNSEMILPMLSGLDRGYAVVGLNYRLAGETHYPAPVKDIKQAIRFLKANADKYQLDGNKIVTWGGSAGGYMSLMSALFADEDSFDTPEDPYVSISSDTQACVAWYPQTDFSYTDEELKMNSQINRFMRREISDVSDEYEPAFPQMEENEFPFHAASNGVIERFLGKPYDPESEIVKAASPINYLKTGVKLPPVFIQHGSDDEILPMQQSIKFALKANELFGEERVRLEIIPHAIHSSILFETEENIGKVLDFIDSILK